MKQQRNEPLLTAAAMLAEATGCQPSVAVDIVELIALGVAADIVDLIAVGVAHRIASGNSEAGGGDE